ncbi:MAG: hypothetical protein EOO75_03155 [Myxococcales bacterium]|nr:MAG: hypothetical protein EOO75_03155 [Myxococcales bacterium]
MQPSLVAIAILVTGCAHGSSAWNADGFRDPQQGGMKQAALRLECPESEVEVTELGDNTGAIGVRGCGKRATYTWIHGVGWVSGS